MKLDEPELRYSVIVEWDPRDDIFIATVPELPGCRTHGDTYEEAIAQVQDAMFTWLAASDEDDPKAPEPRFFNDERRSWTVDEWASAASAPQTLVPDDDGVSTPS